MADFNIAISGGTGPQGPPGLAAPIFTTFHTFAYAGEVFQPAGTSDYLPPFFVMRSSTQVLTLTRARFVLNGGTSANVKLTKNGVDIPGFTNLTVTQTAAAVTGQSISLADGDVIQLVVNTVTGHPQNLTFTVGIQHNVT